MSALTTVRPRRVLRATAELFGITEGQAATLALGLAVGLGSAAIGIPPTLEDRPPSRAASALPVAPDATPEGTGSAAGSGPAGTPGAPGRSGPAANLPTADAPPEPFTAASGGDSSPTAAPAGASATASPPEVFGEAPPLEPFGSVTRHAGFRGRPAGIATTGDGSAFVAVNRSEGRARLLALDPDGTVAGSIAIPTDADGRGLAGVSADPDRVWVARSAPPGLLEVDPERRSVTRTSDLRDLPPCIAVVLSGSCELAPTDNPPRPSGVLAVPDGSVYLLDGGQGIVWKLEPGEEPEPWFSSEEFVSPARLIGVAADPEGNLLLSVTDALVAGTGGVVYRLEVDDDGDPGTLETLAETDRGTDPSGMAVATSARVYVALEGTGAVLVLEPDGEPSGRLRGKDAAAFTSPYATAFAGEAILVTAHDADGRGAVMRIVVAEPGMMVGDDATRDNGAS